MGKLIHDIEDFAGYDDGLIASDAVEDRIEELKQIRDEAESEAEELTADEAAELKMWLEFRRAVENVDGVLSFDGALMVPDELFDRWARNEIEVEYGLNADNVGEFFDYDRYIESRQKHDFTRIDLDGDIVWVASGE